MRNIKFLPKSELVDGVYYRGRCRNATIAVWDAANNLFWYMRCKFGTYFEEDICHPEDDNGFDLFYPDHEGVPTLSERVDFEDVKRNYKDLMERREAYKTEQEKK